MKRITTIFFLTWALANPFSLSQTPQAEKQAQPPALRAAGYTVLVDAVVTDSKNKVVGDLTVDDFVIYEDNVPQTIDSLRLFQPDSRPSSESPASIPRAPSGSAASPVSDTVREPAGPVRERRNLIVFLLDYATTEFNNQKLVQEACEKYIRENLRPNDFVAVFSLGASFRFLQDFTNRRDLLLATLTGSAATGDALAASPAPATGATPSVASVETISVTSDTPGGFAAAGQAAQAQGSGQADLMLAQRIQELYYTMTSYVGKREARAVLSAIQAISRGVEGIEGRKTLFLFSQGFVVSGDVESELQRTVSSANRANLAIYGVDSQGLATRSMSGNLLPSTNELASISAASGRDRIRASGGESLFDRARQVGSDVRDSALRYVSSATGGFAIRHSNDLYISMEKVDEDIRSYYLLSYRPANANFDGQFRNIRVEVKRKGLSVRARSGYLAVPPGMEIFSEDEFQLLKDLETGKLAPQLPIFFRIDKFFSQSERQNVVLSLEIPGNELLFEPVELDGQQKQRVRLSIIGVVRDAQGNLATRFGSPVTLYATDAEKTVLGEGSISFSNAIGLEPGTYSFEVVVQDLASNKTGMLNSGLLLSAPDIESLALSSIVVGKEVEAAQGESGGLDFEGTRILPSASKKFKRSDQLVYFFSVYNFKADAAGNPQLEIAMTVSPSGSSLSIPLPRYRIQKRSFDNVASSSKYIELGGLQPGTYFLTAAVADERSGETVEGRTSFTIVE